MEKTKVTSHELKKINRRKIYQYIYQTRETSRPEISHELQMSFPTITQNLTDLENFELITKNGFLESTGGRKAQKISCNSTAKLAIGLELLKNFTRIDAIDLYGTVLKETIVTLAFSQDDSYFKKICDSVNHFISELPHPHSKILGIGIAIQGLVSADGTSLTYGKILGSSELTLDKFSVHFDLPCIFIHDAEAAASAELWFQKGISNAVYLSLNQNLGSAVILNGCIHRGNTLMGGTIEHMYLIPGGKECYCGKEGCVDSYCSAHYLIDESGEDLDTFFSKLRLKDPLIKKIWNEYLNHLAMTISNIRYVIDGDFIIGGQLHSYFTSDDYQQLANLANKYCCFPVENLHLLPGQCDIHVTAIGAGLHYIKQFLSSI